VKREILSGNFPLPVTGRLSIGEHCHKKRVQKLKKTLIKLRALLTIVAAALVVSILFIILVGHQVLVARDNVQKCTLRA